MATPQRAPTITSVTECPSRSEKRGRFFCSLFDNLLTSILRVLPCIPIILRNEMASLIMRIVKMKATANSDDEVPSCKPTKVVTETAKAVWAEGIPP